jgi:hypothetical protein
LTLFERDLTLFTYTPQEKTNIYQVYGADGGCETTQTNWLGVKTADQCMTACQAANKQYMYFTLAANGNCKCSIKCKVLKQASISQAGTKAYVIKSTGTLVDTSKMWIMTGGGSTGYWEGYADTPGGEHNPDAGGFFPSESINQRDGNPILTPF